MSRTVPTCSTTTVSPSTTRVTSGKVGAPATGVEPVGDSELPQPRTNGSRRHATADGTIRPAETALIPGGDARSAQRGNPAFTGLRTLPVRAWSLQRVHPVPTTRPVAAHATIESPQSSSSTGMVRRTSAKVAIGPRRRGIHPHHGVCGRTEREAAGDVCEGMRCPGCTLEQALRTCCTTSTSGTSRSQCRAGACIQPVDLEWDWEIPATSCSAGFGGQPRRTCPSSTHRSSNRSVRRSRARDGQP